MQIILETGLVEGQGWGWDRLGFWCGLQWGQCLLDYIQFSHYMLAIILNGTTRIARISNQHHLALITQCYTNESIQKRISSLKELPQQLQEFSMSTLELRLPSSLKMTNAKQLLQFHKANKTESNANILHALAFIEFNAFLAYADTLLRFGYSEEERGLREGMSKTELDLFREEIRFVALDEGQHCLLLIERLKQLGLQFGCFPVITNLAATVDLTKEDILQRLALISIVHEGRGVKSIDRLIQKVLNCKDQESAKILRTIQSQEIKHFNIGLKWFNYFCEKKYKNFSEGLSFQDYLQKVLAEINQKYKTKLTLEDLNFKQKAGKAKKKQ